MPGNTQWFITMLDSAQRWLRCRRVSRRAHVWIVCKVSPEHSDIGLSKLEVRLASSLGFGRRTSGRFTVLQLAGPQANLEWITRLTMLNSAFIQSGID